MSTIQDSFPMRIPATTAVQMQAQLSNLIAIQNLQEYLKYLILTTSVEPQTATTTATATPQKLVDVKVEESSQASTLKDSAMSPGPKDHESCAFVGKFEFSASAGKRKRSQKLFSLMQKKFAKKTTVEEPQEESGKSRVISILNKNTKKTLICGHTGRDHYAKGLCSSCYLKVGRTKKPWNCSHEKLYALGLCQKCYTSKYHMTKKTMEGASLSQIKSKLLEDSTEKTLFQSPQHDGSCQMELEQEKPEIAVKFEAN